MDFSPAEQMDILGAVWEKVQETIEQNSSRNPSFQPSLLPSGKAKKLNECVYELYAPPKKPNMQIVFFHGLQQGDYHDGQMFFPSWMSRDRSQYWPQTWLTEIFPEAHVLSLSYSTTTTSTQGISDFTISGDSLLNYIICLANIGVGHECPVLLVGHCLGGLVIKHLCVQAATMLQVKSSVNLIPIRSFLKSIRGIFFFATPHGGLNLINGVTLESQSVVVDELQLLDDIIARINHQFGILREFYEWKVSGIGELNESPELSSLFHGLVVSEASSSLDMDDFSVVREDHFSICQPESKSSTSFQALATFVSSILQQEERFFEYVSNLQPTITHCSPGLEAQAKEIEKKLLSVSVRTMGVVGVTGIGKTALAKLVLSNICRRFEIICFVSEVRLIPGGPGKVLKTVLKNLHSRNGKVKGGLKSLKGKRILFVLDDVNSVDQLISVLPKLSSCESGSRVLVTSQNKECVKRMDLVHVVTGLKLDDAKQLLLLGKPEVCIRESLVQDIVQKCHGLPLALLVMGSYLRNKGESSWREASLKLQEAEAVAGSTREWFGVAFKVSIDGLGQIEREMLLDAATVFYGKPLDFGKQIWNACWGAGSGDKGWATLESRFLVRTKWSEPTEEGEEETYSDESNESLNMARGDVLEDEFSEVQEEDFADEGFGDLKRGVFEVVGMHELVKELGRSIACPPDKSPESWTRTWKESDAERLLTMRQKDSVAETQVLKISRIQCYFKLGSMAFAKMENLRYLSLQYVDVHADVEFSEFSNVVKYISWQGASFSKFPINFRHLKDLSVLELRYCRNLATLPQGFEQLVSLHSMDLIDIPLRQIPEEIQSLPLLDNLNLHLPKLAELPDSFTKLRLRTLKIYSCDDLAKLPESFGSITSLQKLYLQYNSCLEALPESFGGLSNLQELEIFGSCIRNLPESFGSLSSLRQLKFFMCNDLEELPKSFGHLVSLVHLSLERLPKLQIASETFEHLHSLQRLWIWGCKRLQRLPMIAQLSSLQQLELLYCESLERLPESMERMPALQYLEFRGLPNVQRMPNCLRHVPVELIKDTSRSIAFQANDGYMTYVTPRSSI